MCISADPDGKRREVHVCIICTFKDLQGNCIMSDNSEAKTTVINLAAFVYVGMYLCSSLPSQSLNY